MIKDSGKQKQFEGGMVRDTDEGKTNYTLIPHFIRKRWADLYTAGAVKYGKNNWMQALGEEEKERFKESACRHFFQWLNGEVDEDHAAAVFFNITGVEHIKLQNSKK